MNINIKKRLQQKIRLGRVFERDKVGVCARRALLPGLTISKSIVECCWHYPQTSRLVRGASSAETPLVLSCSEGGDLKCGNSNRRGLDVAATFDPVVSSFQGAAYPAREDL